MVRKYKATVLNNALHCVAEPAQPVAAEPAAAELADLIRLANGLTPCWNSPLKFHERKSELLMRLRKLARWAREAEASQREGSAR
jgi:hypothetical protein